MDLFRKEVYQSRSSKVFGDVVAATPIAGVSITLFIFGVVAAITVFLSTAEYTRKTTVSGILTPATSIANATSPLDGQIGEVFVQEGQRVDANAPLFEVVQHAFLNSGNEFHHERTATILQRIQMLQDWMVNEREITSKRQHDLQAEQELAAAQVNSLNRRLAIARHQESLMRRNLERAQELFDRGMLSQNELEATEIAFVEQSARAEEFELNILEANRQLERRRAQIDQLPQELERSLYTNQLQISELESELLALEISSSTIVKAPFDGYINNLEAHTGQIVVNGSELATIIPSDTPLVANFYAPSASIGFIKAGDNVRLRYDAFPYQRFGLFNATITDVGSSLIMPRDQRAQGGSNVPVYLVKGELEQEQLSAYGAPLQLKPGMRFEADIEHEQRSLIRWLFDPIYSVVGSR
jgi:membrane fusion protein